MAHYPRTDRRCLTCLRFPDFTGRDMMHWRSCVPRRDWPTFTDVPAVVVTDAGSLIQGVTFTPDAVICDCGFVAKSAFGLRSHRRKHEAVTSA
ncbi:MAG: hypothetical protein NUW22_13945 [Acidobacteria bacterium]|nr:hypothetical protein [Acidobacteriota bacterium]